MGIIFSFLLYKRRGVCYNTIQPPQRGSCYVPVAQLDSALDSDSKGRRFESCRAYQIRQNLNMG